MAISGPISPYSNVPIEPQWYQPRRFEIADVTLGQATLIETDVTMDYVIGQEVRLLIPQPYGCWQLSGISGYVIDVPASNLVLVDIDSSTNVDQFIPAIGVADVPQIVAIGDINSGAVNFGRTNNITFIEGSFINISPTS